MNIAPLSSRKLDIRPLSNAVKNVSGMPHNVWRDVENLIRRRRGEKKIPYKLEIKSNWGRRLYNNKKKICVVFYCVYVTWTHFFPPTFKWTISPPNTRDMFGVLVLHTIGKQTFYLCWNYKWNHFASVDVNLIVRTKNFQWKENWWCEVIIFFFLFVLWRQQTSRKYLQMILTFQCFGMKVRLHQHVGMGDNCWGLTYTVRPDSIILILLFLLFFLVLGWNNELSEYEIVRFDRFIKCKNVKL